ncbi:dTDP-4-dehydrorhamnose 3,5-epimerase [Candidatus Nitrospira allomarina]|jgi:dTDP-4-dehydrorhamnose 3,5-epimerase|uniref:dTDP-4-dehydrorhamnose 3,5-epimerase n=1 Tax=Candidatus Nitrospira allomarina TaxID=3020900 RepID=A0AA96GD42_9BACT|nr:dTDP-4-dehydrorhamnose 3,5-epimerase [Candidatus Nitrospira allomarina]WNM59904.1 dTDP-4-dehydrorhamnose 3,5-epimerase [Candidatus Nitrospira allomarina]
MKFLPTRLPEVLIVEPDVYRDQRGWFLETYHIHKYQEAGILPPFVQDNCSSSVLGTLRGLHFQMTSPQGKLIRVIRGEIFDVAVDIRKGSPTFASWVGVTLSAEDFRQIYVPMGFAHGFCVLSEVAEVEYKCTDVYAPGGEVTIRWNDPRIGIQWPIEQPLLSAKDAAGQGLDELSDQLPDYQP